MKIIQSILVFSKESKGGAGKFLAQLSTLHIKGYRFLFYLYKKETRSDLKSFHLINLSYPLNFDLSFQKIILFIKNLFFTFTIFVKKKPVLILACDQYSIILLLILKRLNFQQIPHIVIINNNLIYLSKEKNYLYRNLFILVLRWLLPRADRIVFVSQDLKKNHVNYFNLSRKKSIVIYRAVKINNNYLLGNLKNEELDENIKIISVGRFDRQKDFFTLLYAFAEVHKNNPDLQCSLILIGDGELKRELMDLRSKLQLNNYVHFLGWKNNIYSYLKSADIFVFSSFYEGFPNVILEAMKCGLPIIATNSPFGVEEIISHNKFGILVDVGDVTQMCKALYKFIKDKSLRLYYSNRSLIRIKFFDQQKMIRSYAQLILKTIKTS